MGAPCVFIVDADPATDPDDDLYRVGTIGPLNAPADLCERLQAGQGRRWRTKYERGEDPEHHDIVHEGRILTDDDGGSEADFLPLWLLSGPDCGAVDIEYLTNGRWETL